MAVKMSDAWLTGAPIRQFRSDPSVDPQHTSQCHEEKGIGSLKGGSRDIGR